MQGLLQNAVLCSKVKLTNAAKRWERKRWNTGTSYLIADVLQLLSQHRHVVFEEIPLMLQIAQVRFQAAILVVHSLKTFFYFHHLDRKKLHQVD